MPAGTSVTMIRLRHECDRQPQLMRHILEHCLYSVWRSAIVLISAYRMFSLVLPRPPFAFGELHRNTAVGQGLTNNCIQNFLTRALKDVIILNIGAEMFQIYILFGARAFIGFL